MVSIDTAFSGKESSRECARFHTARQYIAQFPFRSRRVETFHAFAGPDTNKTPLLETHVRESAKIGNADRRPVGRRRCPRHNLPRPKHPHTARAPAAADPAACKRPLPPPGNDAP